MIGTEAALGVSPASEAELFVILCPVGPYFASGLKPVNLLADPNYIRAWPGGCGFAKMGSNYAPTLWIGVSSVLPKLSSRSFSRFCREIINEKRNLKYS